MVYVTYGRACLVHIVAGLMWLVLIVVLAASKGWVQVQFEQIIGDPPLVFQYGAFDLTDDYNGVAATLPKNTGTNTLQAMLIVSIIVLVFGLILSSIAATKRWYCSCNPNTIFRFGQLFYVASSLFLLIGIGVYTDYWNQHGSTQQVSVSDTNYTIESHSYPFSYILAWVVCLLFIVYNFAYIVYINCVVRLSLISPADVDT